MEHSEFFLQMEVAFNNRDFDHVADWFTEDFKLYEPGSHVPAGHAGAKTLLQAFANLGSNLKAEVLDVVEAGDRAAVRWLFTAERDGQRVVYPSIAIYRFVDGRIAEDWGIVSTKNVPWA